MGSMCSVQMIPIIKVDKGDYNKADNTKVKAKAKLLEKEMSPQEGNQSKTEKVYWEPPQPTPMPKGMVLTPEPSRLTVDDNGARLSVEACNSSSDVFSQSGSSMRSSTDCSVSSGRSFQIIDRAKAPPRLLSLSTDLHKLLMGRLEDPRKIQSRPKVIHLQLVAPSDDCTRERQSLWQNTFTPLRKLCAERGYSLDIQDVFWIPYSTYPSCVPSLPGHFINGDGGNNDVDVLVILLTDDYVYCLPDHVSYEDFQFLSDALENGDDPSLAALHKTVYKKSIEGKDSARYLLQRRELDGIDKQKVSKLVSHLVLTCQTSGMATTHFYSPYYRRLKSIVSNASLLGKRTVVVSRLFSHIMNFDATSGYDLDPSKECEDQEELSRIQTGVEKGCDPSRRVKLELPHGDSKFHKERDVIQVYLKEMGITVCRLLKGVIETFIDDKEMEYRATVTGVSQSLIDELVSQAIFTCSLTQVEPMFYSSTLRCLQEYVINFTEMPIVVYAPPGWGLSTMGAQLAEYCKKEMPNALVMYRSLGITPDTVTLQSTLLSLNQQLDTILGNKGHWEDNMHTFPTKSLLKDVVTRSTFHLPIIIFLEGVTLATSKLKELEVMTLNESLPPTTKLIVMTSDAAVTRGLRLKMKDAFYVKAVPWEKQCIADLFSKATSDQMLFLSDSHTSMIANAIKQCPTPLFGITAAQIVYILYQNGQLASGLTDFPTTMEGIIKRLFDVLDNYFPKNCFQSMMAYLCASVGGLTPWEMNDLLSSNDFVIKAIFPNEKEPIPLCRSPTNLWKSFVAILKPFLRVYISTHFYTKCWASCTLNRYATERYIRQKDIFESLNKEMSEYFEGRWSNKRKPLTDSGDQTQTENENPHDRYLIPQLTKYGQHNNVRKLHCLPQHTMLYNSKSSSPLERFILNLSWIVNKLDAVSCIQVLLDIESAKAMDYSHAHPNDLDSLQGIVFKSSSSLTMCGKEVYKILQHSVIRTKYKSNKELYKSSIYYNSTSYYKMIQSIDKVPFSYLISLDKEITSLPQLSPIPSPMVNDIVHISDKSTFVAAVLRQEGEIRIINSKTNIVVRTLKGLDHPTTLKMMDESTAAVLCNRELYVINLDEGTILKKLRIVLNLRMPYFGLQNKERLVALSRDRMSVNVLDLKTGGIVSSFKAGETRFLESLLLSQDGKMVVCGDETQKPYPLLAWSLEQGKLVHDIRMSQHEFLTKMADITQDGHYLACGCKEVSVSGSNFIVVYDLISGQLLKKFKMAGLVTALVISSQSLTVIAALDTAQLVVWEIVSGNRRLLLDGVHASVDNIRLSQDGRRCLTSCRQEYSISAHTLSLWDIEKGHLLGTHTFHAQVSCVHLSWEGNLVLAGVRGHSQPIRLQLVLGEQENNHKNSGGKIRKLKINGGNEATEVYEEEVFGSYTRVGLVIQVSNSLTP